MTHEYARSDYSQMIKRKEKKTWRAKVNGIPAIGGMIEIAENPSPKEKSKHRNSGYYFRYDTKIAVPSGYSDVKIYNAKLNIYETQNGKKFLYDIVDVKGIETVSGGTKMIHDSTPRSKDVREYDLNGKGIHVKTVANSAEQSYDRPSANPALIGSNGMPSSIISESGDNASGKKENFEENNIHSIRKHNQVNPFRMESDAAEQHKIKLDEPYRVRGNEELNRKAQSRIAGLGGMNGAIQSILKKDFAVGSDVSQRVVQLVLNSPEFRKLNADARAKISDLYINNMGTEIARSLAARRLGVLSIDDIDSIQAHLNAFMAKIDKMNPKNSKVKMPQKAMYQK